ncbi:MAG: tail assembly chaperone [Lachnospiraceae bacterium]|nr:MAG TPA: tail assembly chaperone [Caudoviricetes sp.]
MYELTINDVVYQFNFGMGFMREVNKKVCTPVDGLKDVKKNIGLQYLVASILDGDVEALVEILAAANKGQNPRVTNALLDAYIDDENTDIDKLFEEVIDFLSNANATKKVTEALLKAMEEQKNKN